MAQQIFIQTGKGVSGPYSAKQIREMASTGTLLPSSLISFDQQNWGEASALKGLTFPDHVKPTVKSDGPQLAKQIGKSMISRLQIAAEAVGGTVSKMQSNREVVKQEQAIVLTQKLSAIQRYLNDEQDPKVIENTVPRIQQFLTSGEELFYIAVQKKPVANFLPDCVALTSKRVIFFTVKMLGQLSFNDHLWRNIHDATIKEGILGATFSATVTNGQRMSIDYLPKAQARMLYRFAQEMEENAVEERRTRMMEEKRAAAGGVVIQNAMSPHPAPSTRVPVDDPVATLQKLKSMLDAGLISPEEFASKKTEILTRM
jgi:hypothetical protein